MLDKGNMRNKIYKIQYKLCGENPIFYNYELFTNVNDMQS